MPPASAAPSKAQARLAVIVLGVGTRDAMLRTVASLQPGYQKAQAGSYAAHLVEFRSPSILTESDRAGFPTNLSHTVVPSSGSLAAAVNRSVEGTRETHVLLCVDAAPILSAGIVNRALQVIRINPRAVMVVPGLRLQLGPDGGETRPGGDGDPRSEDELFRDIEFPSRPNLLFSVSRWESPGSRGWFEPCPTSSALLVPRDLFGLLGGYDEADRTPDGALARADFYARAVADVARPVFIALGEAIFRQPSGADAVVPGDVATTTSLEAGTDSRRAEAPKRPMQLIGVLPPLPRRLAAVALLETIRAQIAQMPTPPAPRAATPSAESGAAAQLRRSVVLVIGMHRSGTSFLAGRMVANGLRVPGPQMEANFANPDGYHEPMAVVSFNDRVLADRGLCWASLGRIDWEAAGQPDVGEEADRLQRMLLDLDATEPEGDTAGWIIKDPRLCRVWPVWERAIGTMGLRPAKLLVLRDPTLVARSLARRNGFNLDFGRLLWARHVEDVLRHATTADDVLSLDDADASDLVRYVGARTGLSGLTFADVKRFPLPAADDPISRLYRAFLTDRDLEAFRHGLAGEIAILDRYPGLARRLDSLGPLPA